MNTNRSVSFKPETLARIKDYQARLPFLSFSTIVGKIVEEHAQQDIEIVRQDAVKKLRAAATVLKEDCDIPQAAIVAWVKSCTGGEEKEKPPAPKKKKNKKR